MTTKTTLTQLIKTLQRQDTLLLIGSGVSLWSGLPTWSKLIQRLAEYLSSLGRDSTSILKELEKGDLLLAASYGVFQMTSREFDIFITGIFNEKLFRPSEIHDAIIKLGPTSFATSNYDTLLEDAILSDPNNKARPRVVTNKNFIAMPQIIQSSSRDFIFKYHGDINDTGSIVLTREQYKDLKGQNEIVSQTLSTLLATRPVVMLGFGLRDPDFLSIKDELAVSFLGQAGEHFAIMSDFTSMEIEYWRKNYNIEVISYNTKTDTNGNPDHSELLTLLKSLHAPKSNNTINDTIQKEEWNGLLSRLAGRYLKNKSKLDEFPLSAEVKKNNQRVWKGSSNALLETHENLAIIGGAGSGKSHLLRSYATRMSQNLLESCWVNVDTERKIPILADLRQYSGSLIELLQAQLPETLKLEKLIQREQCHFLLDGANEMPEEFIESGRFLDDISALLRDSQNCQIAITGRNGSWKEKLEFSTAELLTIDDKWLTTFLVEAKNANHSLKEDLLKILNTPLMLSLVTSNNLNLSAASTPTDIHKSVFTEFNNNWKKQNEEFINVEQLLSPLAYTMLDQGVELLPYETVKKHLQLNTNLSVKKTDELLELLITEKLINALPDYHIAFFHQTATEYLAALELIERKKTNAAILLEKFSYRRWDQALFFSVSLLPQTEAQSFFNTLCNIDIVSALRAAKYIEHNQEELITSLITLLQTIDGNNGRISASQTVSTICRSLTELPFSHSHEISLLQLMERKDAIGGAAAKALIRLKPSLRSRLLTQMFELDQPRPYISSLSSAFTKDMQPGDLHLLFTIANKNQTNAESITSTLYELRKTVNSEELLDITSNKTEFNLSEVKHAICILCSHQDSNWATDYIQSCIIEKHETCLHSFHINISLRAKNPDYRFIASEALLSALVEYLDTVEHKFGLIEVLKTLSKHDDKIVSRLTTASPAISKAKRALFLIAASNQKSEACDLISSELSNIKLWQPDEVTLFASCIPWKSLTLDIVRKILENQNAILTKELLSNFNQIKYLASSLAPSEWWLQKTLELDIDQEKSTFIELFNISGMIAKDPILSPFFLNKFNTSTGGEFRLLARYIIHTIPSVSTDELSDSAINQLTSMEFGLRTRLGDSVLGLLASESFVEGTLKPLLNSPHADHTQKVETAHALEAAGKKHNRRYLITDEHRQLLSIANIKFTPHHIKGDWFLTTN